MARTYSTLVLPLETPWINRIFWAVSHLNFSKFRPGFRSSTQRQNKNKIQKILLKENWNLEYSRFCNSAWKNENLEYSRFRILLSKNLNLEYSRYQKWSEHNVLPLHHKNKCSAISPNQTNQTYPTQNPSNYFKQFSHFKRFINFYHLKQTNQSKKSNPSTLSNHFNQFSHFNQTSMIAILYHSYW